MLPHVMLGGPSLSEGSGGTYPPTYLAYAIARHVLHDEYATLDAFAWLHILVGYAAAWWTAPLGGNGRHAGLHRGGLVLFLSGSILIVGRCWHSFIPLVVWMPLLASRRRADRRGPVSWKWPIGAGLAVGLSYHGTFVESLGLLGDVLCVGDRVAGRHAADPWRRALWLVPQAGMLAAGIVAPLLVVQFRLAADMSKASGYGEGIGHGSWRR